MFGLISRCRHLLIMKDKDNRIRELEDMMCPYNQHDYIETDSKVICGNYGDTSRKTIYQCKRCKKIKVVID